MIHRPNSASLTVSLAVSLALALGGGAGGAQAQGVTDYKQGKGSGPVTGAAGTSGSTGDSGIEKCERPMGAVAVVEPQDYVMSSLRGYGLGQQGGVFGFLDRLQDQRRVGRRVLRLELGQLLEVAGVGDHGGELFEGVELVHGVYLRSRLNYP